MRKWIILSSIALVIIGMVGIYMLEPEYSGRNSETQLGMAGTLMKGIIPDPKNSLRALIDKDLRQKVIQANKASKSLQEVHVQGIGHEFWVDSSTG